MKILIIHQHYKTPQSGGAIRSYYLAKALVAHGHHVVVITAGQEGTARTDHSEGIEVHYLPVRYDNRFQFYRRAWSFLIFTFSAARLASHYRDFDCCYAISVPLTVGLAARWITYRFHIPYLFEIGDLWPEAPIQLGFIRNYFLKKMLYAMERSNYQNARSIVALSPPIMDAVHSKVPGKTVHYIPNMADCDFFVPQAKDPRLEAKFGVQGKFVVAYVGAMGAANGLEYFLACARESALAKLPVHFILCGEGAMRERLKQLTISWKLNNISFPGFVNRDGVRDILNVTDAVFICYQNYPVLQTGSPNKFFDGLAAGKMIVINFDGWIRREIEEEKCGIALNPEHADDFVTKMKPFIEDVHMLGTAQKAARQLAERKYSRKILSEKFCDLFG